MSCELKKRNINNFYWFWVNNDFFDSYIGYFTPVDIAVYAYLCRCADNKTQDCFPSEKTIAVNIGSSDRTVRKSIKKLTLYRIVVVTKKRGSKGKWLHNFYNLINKSEWFIPKPKELVSSGGSSNIINPEEFKHINRRNLIPLNNTKLNKKINYIRKGAREITNKFSLNRPDNESP